MPVYPGTVAAGSALSVAIKLGSEAGRDRCGDQGGGSGGPGKGAAEVQRGALAPPSGLGGCAVGHGRRSLTPWASEGRLVAQLATLSDAQVPRPPHGCSRC